VNSASALFGADRERQHGAEAKGFVEDRQLYRCVPN
jgi:hypothetical protein